MSLPIPESHLDLLTRPIHGELIEDGALEHLDQLTRHYTTYPHYYGSIFPAEQQAQETRIICRIHATKITLGAIHT